MICHNLFIWLKWWNKRRTWNFISKFQFCRLQGTFVIKHCVKLSSSARNRKYKCFYNRLNKTAFTWRQTGAVKWVDNRYKAICTLLFEKLLTARNRALFIMDLLHPFLDKQRKLPLRNKAEMYTELIMIVASFVIAQAVSAIYRLQTVQNKIMRNMTGPSCTWSQQTNSGLPTIHKISSEIVPCWM